MPMKEAVRKAGTLIEALPYLKRFRGETVVIKLGGSAQDDPAILQHIFKDIDFLMAVGIRPVVVFGGGKRISAAMKEEGLEAKFIHGQRVTEARAMKIVSRVLNDEVGAELLDIMQKAGGTGEILNGRDHQFLRAVKKRIPEQPEVDLGQVGEPVAIDALKAHAILDRQHIPLVAPVACGVGDESAVLYNINGDNASALVARDLHALKIVLISDIPGIYQDKNDPASLLPHLDALPVFYLGGVVSLGQSLYG